MACTKTALLVILVMAVTVAGEHCLSEESLSDITHSVMTPYRQAIRGPLDLDELIPKGFKARFLWHIVRNGIRGPDKQLASRFRTYLGRLHGTIMKRHEENRTSICEENMNLLKNWDPEHIPEDDGLTPEGEEEIRDMAARFGEAFPHLMCDNIENHPGVNKFISSNDTVSLDTAKAYMKGAYKNHTVPISTFWTGLEFEEKCKIFQGLYIQPLEGEAFKDFVSWHSRRIGAFPGYPPMFTAYLACEAHRRWYPDEPSPWCVIFSEQDLRALEYAMDHFYYEAVGHGEKKNYRVACDLGKDLINQLTAFVETDRQFEKTRTYFGGRHIISALVAQLGLFNDSRPLSLSLVSDFRQWKAANFAGFGANLAFILSAEDPDSPENEDLSGPTNWWVSAALNEAPLLLPGCSSPLGCPWPVFKAHFQYLKQCNFADFCPEGVLRYGEK